MITGFQHPDTGIPCIASYDEDGETLTFDIENPDENKKHNSEEAIQEVYKWCMRNVINCYSEDQAIRHMRYLGIREDLEWF
jgi:hypothetical protein